MILHAVVNPVSPRNNHRNKFGLRCQRLLTDTFHISVVLVKN